MASPKGISEKNAYEINKRSGELYLYSVDNLPTAHGIMPHGLVEESERFRTHPVDIVDLENRTLFFTSLPSMSWIWLWRY